MPASGSLLREQLGGRRLGAFPSLMLRLVLSSILAATVVGIGSAAMLCTTGPEWTSLLLEPLSLVLLPGLFVSIMASGPHDFEPHVVVNGTIVFYFVVIWSALEWRAWRQRQRRGRD